MFVKKGDIFYANLGVENVIGNEQRGVRPILVIQNDVGNKYSNTIVVASLTSQIKKDIPTHVLLEGRYKGMQYPSTVLLEQIRTIDKSRLIKYLDSITRKDMTKVNRALIKSLGLEGEYTDVK